MHHCHLSWCSKQSNLILDIVSWLRENYVYRIDFKQFFLHVQSHYGNGFFSDSFIMKCRTTLLSYKKSIRYHKEASWRQAKGVQFFYWRLYKVGAWSRLWMWRPTYTYLCNQRSLHLYSVYVCVTRLFNEHLCRFTLSCVNCLNSRHVQLPRALVCLYCPYYL